VAACRLLGLEPWQDPHNDDSRYQRVRVRRAVLPVLESELGPGIAAALSRTAELLAADADALDALARDALADCNRGGPASGQAALAADRLIALPGAVRSRVLRLAALDAGSPAGDLTAGHITALEHLLVPGRGGRVIDLPGRVRARRVRDGIVFSGGPVAG
jgi:tRNA(Ile)-lysidine synthase